MSELAWKVWENLKKDPGLDITGRRHLSSAIAIIYNANFIDIDNYI